MDNEDIFEAEAVLEGTEAGTEFSGYISSINPEIRAKVVGNSGYDKQPSSITTEESLLLPNGSSRSHISGEGDENAPRNTSGSADFEGLPWWKKPSVRLC